MSKYSCDDVKRSQLTSNVRYIHQGSNNVNVYENRKYKSYKIFPNCYHYLKNSVARGVKGRKTQHSAGKKLKCHLDIKKYSEGNTLTKNSEGRNIIRRTMDGCWQRDEMIHPAGRDERDEMICPSLLCTDVNIRCQDRCWRPTHHHPYRPGDGGNLYFITFIYFYLSPIYFQYQYIVYS